MRIQKGYCASVHHLIPFTVDAQLYSRCAVLVYRRCIVFNLVQFAFSDICLIKLCQVNGDFERSVGLRHERIWSGIWN